MAEKAIRTEKLTRDFGEIRALDELTLEVPSGIIFGFLGPNGSGKTTTINLLLGLLEPTSGHAEVLGFSTQTQADELRLRTGALLDHPGLYEQLSAEDNLEFYARVWRIPDGERQSRIKELLTQMGLWERRAERVMQWSTGMKQKLAMARALMHHPSLVFLDEPTAGLDVMAATTLREDLVNLANREGVTVFLTTHNMQEAEKLCSLIGVIRQGKLVAINSPDELRKRTGGPHIEIVGNNFSDGVLNQLRAQPKVVSVAIQNDHLMINLSEETDAAPLVSILVSAGVQVEEVIRGKASLEEVFLTLMEEES